MFFRNLSPRPESSVNYTLAYQLSDGETGMTMVQKVEYEVASPEVKAVYDDIMTSRKVDWINNFGRF